LPLPDYAQGFPPWIVVIDGDDKKNERLARSKQVHTAERNILEWLNQEENGNQKRKWAPV
jgi:hypothetical protein